MKKHLILYILLGILPLSCLYGCAKPETFSYTYSDIGFDTVITFKATCTEKEYKNYETIVKETFKEYDTYFDQYTEYEGLNNVWYLNHHAYNNPVEVNDVLLDCIQASLTLNEMNANFDITYGSLLHIWHTYREQGTSIPSQEEIQQAYPHAGKDKLVIKGNTITYLDPAFKIDLGGIAKGYTCQKIKEKLNAEGLYNGFINAGGNIVLLGPKADGSDWAIGIQNPNGDSTGVYMTFKDECAIVTSGDYQRFYEVDDKRYHHIIDLKTGYPATYCRSVTIITNDSTLADFLSTALFCMSYEDGKAFIDSLDGVEAVWMIDKGKVSSPALTLDSLDVFCTEGIKNQLFIG